MACAHLFHTKQIKDCNLGLGEVGWGEAAGAGEKKLGAGAHTVIPALWRGRAKYARAELAI